MFIDKVRHLEQQNKVLETELVSLRQKHGEPSRVGLLYQEEMRDLRCQLDELNRDKNQILIERNNMEDELQVTPDQGLFGTSALKICITNTFLKYRYGKCRFLYILL